MRLYFRDWIWLTIVLGLAFGWWLDGPARRLRLRLSASPRHRKVYYVGDLVPIAKAQRADFNALVTDIQKTVSPSDWGLSDDDARIEVFASNHSLVVSHTPSGHQELAEHLRDIREELAQRANSR